MIGGICGWSSADWALAQDAKVTPATRIADELTVTVSDGTALIASRSGPVLGYLPQSGLKPVFFPVRTLDGRLAVRRWPVVDDTAEKITDHIHHRGLWFTYGDIDGVDYWAEKAKQQGTIRSDSLEVSDSDTAKLSTHWTWLKPDGSRHLSSDLTMTAAIDASTLVLDFDITLKADQQDLHFGDTKEGAFAIRVPSTMAVDSKQGGSILNSEGHSDRDSWGQSAPFVIYTGPLPQDDSLQTAAPEARQDVLDGSQTGGGDSGTGSIAILVHPKSFAYPGRWHVRTYGLFAHNPFGVKDFAEAAELNADEKAREGGFTLKRGDQLDLKYRVLVSDAVLEPSMVERYWKDFAGL